MNRLNCQGLSQHCGEVCHNSHGLANIMMMPACFFMKRKDRVLNGFIVIPFTSHHREMGLGAFL